MKVNGREVKFMYNVLASIEIAQLCPEGKLENIGQLFEGSYSDTIKSNNAFIIALNRGYVESEKYKNPSYDGTVLTEEELLHLDTHEYLKLQDEAYAAYIGDNKRTIETEPVKTKTGKKTGATKAQK